MSALGYHTEAKPGVRIKCRTSQAERDCQYIHWQGSPV